MAKTIRYSLFFLLQLLTVVLSTTPDTAELTLMEQQSMKWPLIIVVLDSCLSVIVEELVKATGIGLEMSQFAKVRSILL